MKISEVTVEDVKDYLRIEDNYDDVMLKIILDSAKSHIKSHIGISDEELDKKEDLTIALLVLCHEMYDNRIYTTEGNTKHNRANLVIDSILNKHCVNLL